MSRSVAPVRPFPWIHGPRFVQGVFATKAAAAGLWQRFIVQPSEIEYLRTPLAFCRIRAFSAISLLRSLSGWNFNAERAAEIFRSSTAAGARESYDFRNDIRAQKTLITGLRWFRRSRDIVIGTYTGLYRRCYLFFVCACNSILEFCHFETANTSRKY